MKNKVLKLVSIILVLLIFLGIVVFGIYLNSKHKKIFNQSTFYFVCAFKSKSFKSVESRQEDVKKMGGSGKIYQKDKFYYMVLNVYSNYESANQVVGANKEIYPEIEVLEIKTEKINAKSRIKIRNNEKLYQIFKFFKNGAADIMGFSMGRLSGDLSENKFCSHVLKSKFEFEEQKVALEVLEESELKKFLNSSISLMVMYHDAFLNGYFDSDKKTSVVCDFVVSFVLVYIDFVNNL